MGPLIPNGIIPAEWNFVIALLIGIVFGFVLEASGFSSSRKIAGVFYGYDFAVLKVFFTAALVSMIGIYYMDYFQLINVANVFVLPTYTWSAILGGVLMGLGFVLAGFCPGTTLCAAAIGKIDAMATMVGIFIGIFIFSEAYDLIEPIFDASYLGRITIMDSLNISPYWFIFIFSIIAIITFYVSDVIRKRVKKVFY